MADQARHQSQPSAISATPATQSNDPCRQVPRLPRETKVDVTKYHACHVKRRWMSPSATTATQKAAASTRARGNRARHQSQPSAIRATPATQSDDKLRDDKLCVSKWCDDKWSDDKLCDDKLCVDKLCEDKWCDDKWCDEKWSDDKWCDDKLCVSKWCDEKWSDDKLCDDKLCVDKLCEDKWCEDKWRDDKLCVNK